jgi:site-specific recombinase XerD
LELFYSSGIRLREMTHLAVNDLDLGTGRLRIEHAKFARSRVVPLGTKAAECLREYLSVVRSEWTAAGHEERAVWLSVPRPHHPLGCRAIYSIVRAIGKAAGVRRPVSPHVWRHTCASHLVSRGAPIPHVQRLLGHRSLNTTQIYARVTIPELRKTFQRTHPRALERSVYVPNPIVS